MDLIQQIKRSKEHPVKEVFGKSKEDAVNLVKKYRKGNESQKQKKWEENMGKLLSIYS
jgi:hypothetical protein